jgi:aminoglycoside phosphotransferase (APT) family kinase protein
MRPVWTPDLDFDLDRVRWLIARDLPELVGEPIAVVGEGWDNLAVRVGERWLLRLARRSVAAALLEREHRWVSQVTATLEVAVPVVVQLVPATPEHPLPYAVHRWLDGDTGCRAQFDPSQLAESVGRFLAGLHRVPVPAEAPVDELGRGDHVRRETRAVAGLAEVGVAVGSLGFAPLYGDLYARHLLVKDGALAGVIDWGDVHAGNPAVDLSIAYSLFAEPARGCLFAAYGAPVDEAMHVRARCVALDYAAALIPYGRATGDAAAEAVGWTALRNLGVVG